MSSAPPPNEVLDVFDTLGPHGTPFTTPEVADEFDCTRRTISERLEVLAGDGVLRTKKVGTGGRVWWRPVSDDRGRAENDRSNADSQSSRVEQPPPFHSDGEMAERIRQFEWAETPLGPIADWPSQLRIAVDIMLGANEAIGIYWGDDRRLLYNDAALEQLGENHPDALGRPARDVFPEAWETLEPIYDGVMAGDGSARKAEFSLPLERNGEPEDSWWDVTFNPIPDGDDSVGGLFTISFEVTDRVRAKRELRESKRRYRRLFESINEGFCIVDVIFEDEVPVDYRVVEANETFETFTGLENPDGRTVNEMGAELERYWYERYGQVARTGESMRFEEYVEAWGKWFDVFAFPVGDEASNEVAILFDDITEHKRAEENLRKSKERFRALVTASSEVVYRMSPDWSEMHELEGKAFLADTDESTSDWLDKYIHPDEQPRVLAAIDEAIRTKSTFELEHRVEREDGSTGWTFSRAVPMLDEDGEIEEWIGMASDITERKRRERALEKSERRYRALAENFPDGAVGMYDHDLRYTLTEGSVLGETLPSADRLEDNRMPELFPEDTVADLEPVFRAAVEDGETGKTTTEFGGRNWRVWAVPLCDPDGDIFAGLSFAQDITEQVAREQRLEEVVDRLEESNDRLEQFAYAASHDLQEPLRMVISYLRLLENRYADAFDEDGEEFLGYAVDGAERMREMIDALLAYSRIDTQGEPFEPVDLNAVLEDVVADLQVQIEEHGADVTIEELPRVEGDASQLRQLFQNLLDNAITYSGDEAPRVHVGATRRGDERVISVEDEGIGIEPEDQDRIFTVFDRLHSHDTYEGTGIGLALCQRIVERHGGEIWVESEPDEGSTFSVTLPSTET
ncbi:PAS domain-containing sensor histidine kinase [Natronococcus occultus]|uniref:histidine kinase n=1 Tax=Natronococcus occultus SP4 TaxID=694430 RepID=L0JZY4_9EURY|nr:ATP-binding protein [Natronococcus occultus]AGB37428.1 PAS domain S-box [Natronococcus occultus SP4]